MTIASPCQSIVGKRQRQQGREAEAAGRPVQVAEHDLDVPAVFPQQLAAGAARRRRPLRIGDHGDAGEDRVPLGQGLDQRHPLGADGQAVGRALDIGAGDDVAVGGLERGADPELREGGARELAPGSRRDQQGVDCLSAFDAGRLFERDPLPAGLVAAIASAPAIGQPPLLPSRHHTRRRLAAEDAAVGGAPLGSGAAFLRRPRPRLVVVR
jgi:hypothetical protein